MQTVRPVALTDPNAALRGRLVMAANGYACAWEVREIKG